MGIYGNSLKYINEGFANRVKLGIENILGNSGRNIYKEHKSVALENIITKQKNVEDLKYIRRDINSSIKLLESIIEKLKNPNKYDEKTISKLKKKYLKEDTTIKDLELYNKWLKNDCRKLINDRMKEVIKED